MAVHGRTSPDSTESARQCHEYRSEEAQMNHRRLWGVLAFLVLITALVTVWRIDRVFAQAGPGYTKLNTAAIIGLTYTDTTVIDGNVYQYQVTAFCATTLCVTGTGQPVVGESIPMTGNVVA